MNKIIKNPVLIAVVAGVLAYTYMAWKRREQLKKSKKARKNKKLKYVDIIIPGIIAVIAWFLAYGYLHYNVESIDSDNIQPMNGVERVPTYRLVNDVSVTPTSFTLLNPVGGITCPNKLPDVFIEPF
jgi:hypothetical protein